GDLQFDVGSEVKVDDGIHADVNNVTDRSKRVYGGGEMQIHSKYDWFGSDWEGPGWMKLGDIDSITLPEEQKPILTVVGVVDDRKLGRTLLNYGKVDWRANKNIILNGAANIVNQPAAIIDLTFTDDQSLKQGGTGYLQNDGILRKSTGTNSATIEVPSTNFGT